MRLIGDSHRIISVIGMSKNAGKTVTLGYLIEEAFESGRILGLTSIGRDGETTDIVTASDKPRVFVYEGTIVATAEMLFELCEARMEILRTTKYQTPMGRVIIARVLEDGYVQIGGASTNTAIRALAEEMLELGANLVFVDGALDRASPASPVISDACVLATGAAVDRYMRRTVEKTAHLTELFKLRRVRLGGAAGTSLGGLGESDAAAGTSLGGLGESKPPTAIYIRNLKDLEALFDTPEPDIIDSEGRLIRLSGVKTALGAGSALADVAGALEDGSYKEKSPDGSWSKPRYIVVKGALIYKTIRDFMESYPDYASVEWIIRDATRIFIEPMEWKLLQRSQVSISVMEEVELLAVTANPTSPYSYSYDGDEFLEELRLSISDVPVVNVMALDD